MLKVLRAAPALAAFRLAAGASAAAGRFPSTAPSSRYESHIHRPDQIAPWPEPVGLDTVSGSEAGKIIHIHGPQPGKIPAEPVRMTKYRLRTTAVLPEP